MLTNQQIFAIAKQEVEKNEKIGDQAGGSGHSAHTSYEINRLHCQTMDNGNHTITCEYTVFTETEFTYYPDNPPYERQEAIQITVNDNMDQVIETKKVQEYDFGDGWEEVKEQILIYLTQVLSKIEWYYGENRAPFKYPPKLSCIATQKREVEYIFHLEPDLAPDNSILEIKNKNAQELFKVIKKTIPGHFNLVGII